MRGRNSPRPGLPPRASVAGGAFICVAIVSQSLAFACKSVSLASQSIALACELVGSAFQSIGFTCERMSVVSRSIGLASQSLALTSDSVVRAWQSIARVSYSIGRDSQSIAGVSQSIARVSLSVGRVCWSLELTSQPLNCGLQRDGDVSRLVGRGWGLESAISQRLSPISRALSPISGDSGLPERPARSGPEKKTGSSLVTHASRLDESGVEGPLPFRSQPATWIASFIHSPRPPNQ